VKNKYIFSVIILLVGIAVLAQGPNLNAIHACGENQSLGSIEVDLEQMDNYPYTFSIEEKINGKFEEMTDLELEILTGTQQFSFNNLEAGEYRISAIDGCGCQWGGSKMLHAGLDYSECLATVEENCCTWTVDYSKTNASCEENIGSISINIEGGSGNFSYQWDGFPSFSNQSTVTDLASGIYNVTITDNDWLCSETLAISIKKLLDSGIAQTENTLARNVQYGDNTFGSQSQVKVKIPAGDRKISASLYNLSGSPVKSVLNNQVLSQGDYTFDVNVSDLFDGMYILVGEVSCPDDNIGKIDTDIGIKN